MMCREEILKGIEAELETTPRSVEFHVRSCQPGRAAIRVYLQDDLSILLTAQEDLEGASVWWAGGVGTATVASVGFEEGKVYLELSGAMTRLPRTGETIRIIFPRYLEALHRCWQDEDWAQECLRRFQRITQANAFDEAGVVNSDGFPRLRPCQRDAFRLPAWSGSFLLGPPGTGKTVTLGALTAQFLVQFPSARVLLVSNTNRSVDQALVMVDKALEFLSKQVSAAHAIRTECVRVGSNYCLSHFKGREHLIRTAQRLGGGERLPELELPVYRNVLGEARLIAMTTTRAMHTLDELRQFEYALLACEETGQVGLAHSLGLLPLARKALFAGDPKQLGPVVKSRHPAARCRLGRSLLEETDQRSPWVCWLDEQSRMAAEICEVVSRVFYDGKLAVANDCVNHSQWLNERALPAGAVCPCPVNLLTIDAEGMRSEQYGGQVRSRSAECICGIVRNLASEMEGKKILVLTPFRAQERLIRELLGRAGCRGVTVSTVHRAQGCECHTVIFDPVNGTSEFLKTLDGYRLINVALSRAKARLVIVLSAGDRRNGLLRRIAESIERIQAKFSRPEAAA